MNLTVEKVNEIIRKVEPMIIHEEIITTVKKILNQPKPIETLIKERFFVYMLFLYAFKIVKGRYRGIEHIIAKDPEIAIEYALYVIKGRMIEAEPHIMKYPHYTLEYSKLIIKGRWIEAEHIMKKDLDVWEEYCNFLYNAGRNNKLWLEYLLNEMEKIIDLYREKNDLCLPQAKRLKWLSEELENIAQKN